MTRVDVENALLEMGMPVALSGFNYIVSAVLKLDAAEWKYCKVVALYAQIGKEFNSTGSRVERAIRHAFETVRLKGNVDFVQKYIGFDNNTNFNSLCKFLLVLKRENDSLETLPPNNERASITPPVPDSIEILFKSIYMALAEYFAYTKE